jgi:hypothetical protein
MKKLTNYAKANSLDKLLLGIGVGFSLLTITSHPRSKLYQKLPRKNIKNLSVLPNIILSHKGKTYHFHHWILLSIIYSSLVFKKELRRYKSLHGVFIGAIAQGLFYPDRFRVRKSLVVEPLS